MPFALQSAFEATLGLVIVFGGIGLLVNGLIVFVVVQALGERAQNRRPSGAGE